MKNFIFPARSGRTGAVGCEATTNVAPGPEEPAVARESGSLTLSVGGTLLDIDASVAPDRLNGLDTDDTVEVTGLCIVERRGRLLYRERIARDSADLRAAERTNLATELHDSLSQNLAAISCELAALRRTGARDCATAIRLSLRQICDPNAFTLRLDLPSVRLHDTAKHAVIRIIRELVSNALRHGRATAIAIEGAAVGGAFTCTVTDNGCGFDSARRPGPETGHFGLSGVESGPHFLRQVAGTLHSDRQRRGRRLPQGCARRRADRGRPPGRPRRNRFGRGRPEPN